MTGNPEEELLARAQEAANNGYVLQVRIPDREINVNVFDAYGSEDEEPDADPDEEQRSVL